MGMISSPAATMSAAAQRILTLITIARSLVARIAFPGCHRLLACERGQEGDVDLYRDHIYPQLVMGLGNPRPIQNLRQKLLPSARGDVLEIGVGPGANFATTMPRR